MGHAEPRMHRRNQRLRGLLGRTRPPRDTRGYNPSRSDPSRTRSHSSARTRDDGKDDRRLASEFWPNLPDGSSPADPRQPRQPDKQSMFNHSRHIIQLPRQCRRIRDLSKAAIENLIAVVGKESTAVGFHAQFGRSTERHDLPLDNSSRKRNYLNRQWKFAQSSNNLS